MNCSDLRNMAEDRLSNRTAIYDGQRAGHLSLLNLNRCDDFHYAGVDAAREILWQRSNILRLRPKILTRPPNSTSTCLASEKSPRSTALAPPVTISPTAISISPYLNSKTIKPPACHRAKSTLACTTSVSKSTVSARSTKN